MFSTKFVKIFFVVIFLLSIILLIYIKIQQKSNITIAPDTTSNQNYNSNIMKDVNIHLKIQMGINLL